ncbi:hypothetical protein [Mesorhizobium sp. WSM3626]|uniref:hypothetical protein n=1 Tax=Mesorhizobium sp. WSM3626 TaxID=1040987 RepID=UPI0012EC5FCB|nr:hypothetical protein [Mesorhizobium sp. WSM3626]
MRHIDQEIRGALNLVGGAVNALKALSQPLMQHRKPSGSVEIGALFVVRVKWFEQHRHGSGSSTHACGWSDFQQTPTGGFRARLPGSYAAAKGKADRNPVIVVEHPLCLLDGELGSLDALPGRRHFQNCKVNHFSAPFRFAIPSQNQQAPAALVPAAPAHRWAS